MSESNQDRIILAEAMGGPIWEAYIKPVEHPECVDLPDPFTDANDDYAVLEWVRQKKEDLSNPGWAGSFGRFAKALKASCWYEVGDYARAALKVIERV